MIYLKQKKYLITSYFIIIIHLCVRYSKSEHVLISYEMPKTMTDTDPNIATWTIEVGASTVTHTIDCFNGKYFGPFGAIDGPYDDSVPNLIIIKTFNNLPPHWSASFSAEFSLLWSPQNVPIYWYFDNTVQWYQRIYHDQNQQNQRVWGDAVENYVCDNANISPRLTSSHKPDYANFIIPYFNSTHTNDSLEIKFTASFNKIWEKESIALSDIYVHVDTCHYTCETCNGPSDQNCVTCPANSIQNGQSCECNPGFISSEWECVPDTNNCQNGFELDQDNICVQTCPIEFCQSCTDFLCTQCDVGYKNLRGVCVEDCPFYTTESGQNCADSDYETLNNPYVVCDYFVKDTITNQDYIDTNFHYLPEKVPNSSYTDQEYQVMSRVGEKCQGKNLIGGRGLDFFIKCSLGVCRHIAEFRDLPPHYQLKVRILVYLLDSWDNHWVYIYFDDIEFDKFRYPTNRPNKFICGKPIKDVIFQDSKHEREYTTTHNSSTFKFEISPQLDQFNGDESLGFREFSIILELCENPLCGSCSGPGLDCDTCKGQFRNVNNQCACLDGYEDNQPDSFDCIPCTNDLCEICSQVDSNQCEVCIGVKNQPKSRLPNYCNCPNGYWDNFENDNSDINCLLCINTRCQTCSNGTQCDTCISPTTRQGNLCLCIDGYYDISNQEDCEKCNIACLTCSTGGATNCDIFCDNKCLGCENNADECVNCKGNRVTETCVCPAGYWETFQENCEECHETCDLQCDQSNAHCTGCMETRVLQDSGATSEEKKQCKCDPSVLGIADPYNRTYFCTTCEYAVLDIKFSNDLSQILIEFADNILIVGYNGFQQNSQEFQIDFCSYLFNEETLQILGEGAQCRHNPSIGIQLQIQLGVGPTILPGDNLSFKQGIIQRDNAVCSGVNFSEYILTEVQEPAIKEIPTVIVLGPTSAITICQEIIFQITEIVNDGFRGLFDFKWNFLSTTASNDSYVKQVLQNATEKQQNFIKFPQVSLQEFSNFKISLTFKNFVGAQGSYVISLNTLGKEGTSTKIQQIAPFVLKNYQLNQFIGDIKYFNCESGTLIEEDKILEVVWEVVQPDNSIEELQKQTTKPKQKQVTYDMPQYSFIAGQTYDLLLTTNIPNGSANQSSSNQVQFKIKTSQLLTYIMGGSRSVAYNEALEIEAIAKDIDVKEEFQTDNLTYEWTCENMSDPNPAAVCSKIDGTPLELTTTTKLSYGAKNLEPYKSFLFHFKAENDEGNVGTTQAAIVIVETNLPMLTVKLPENAIANEINKNDDLQVDIFFDGNPDDVFFSLSLFYNFDIVATKRQSFTSFSFKIWDLFDEFVGNNNELLVRVSMYDPNFFMPSQTSYNLQINIPPKSGTIQINPTSGIAMDTEFQILLSGYYDKDQPLSYKYHIYTKIDDYDLEKEKGESPINFNQHILKDFSNENQVVTKLPQANYNADTYQYDMLVMVTISDSYGALTNVTQSIQVDRPSQSISDQLDNLQNMIDQSQQLPSEQQNNQLIIIGLELFQIDNLNEQNGCNGNGKLENNICKCKNNYYGSDCSMNEKNYVNYNKIKLEVYKKLEEIRPSITSKFIQDQSVKVQKMLLEGDNVVQNLENSEIVSQLDNMELMIQEKQIEIEKIVNSGMWNTGDSKITIRQLQVTGILGSYIGLLDKIQQGIYKESNKRILNDQQTQNLNQNLLKIQSIQSQIDNALQTSQLPNSDKINFIGDTIQKSIQKSTNKVIKDDYFPDKIIQKVYGKNQNKESFYNAENGNTNQTVFKASKLTSNDNPYRLQNDYPYPDQNEAVQDIKISLEDDQDQKNIKIQNPLEMAFDLIENKESKQNVCVSKNSKTDKFDNENCITNIIEDESGDSSKDTVKCDCKELSPSTVINDVDNIFQESNIDEIFGEEGFEALKNFKFWESVIFYSFLVFTSLYIFALYKGFKKDKLDKLKFSNRRKSVLSNIQINDKKQIKETQVYPLQPPLIQLQKIKNDDDDIQSSKQQLNKPKTNSRVFVRKRRKMKNNENNENIQNEEKQDIQQDFKINSLQNIQNEELPKTQSQGSQSQCNNIEENQNQEKIEEIESIKHLEEQNEKETVKQEEEKEKEEIKQKENEQQIISQEKLVQKQESLQNIPNSQKNLSDNQIEEIQDLEQLDKKLVKRSEVIQFVLKVHQLLGIIYLYEEKLSRPARYSIIYCKICVVLAFSSTMATSLNQYYQILWSVIVGVFSSLPIIIITFLFQKNVVGKTIASIIVIGLIGVSMFISVTNAALMEIKESNQWATTYISSQIVDQFFFQIWIGWIKLIIFNASIGMKNGIKIRKLLNLHKGVQESFTFDYVI